MIHHAEATGEKLHDPDRGHYLAKRVTKRPTANRFAGTMVMKEFTCYVEYSIADEDYVVHSAYSHNAAMRS